MSGFGLPYGVQDYLSDECYNKNLAEQRLADVFFAYGYDRVATPALEYCSVFSSALADEHIKKMFKLCDSDGSLLVLRPDITLQIQRLAATRLDLTETNRLYYIADSFEFSADSSTSRSREFAQAGVELLGKSGKEGDLEVVLLAIESLKNAGLDNFLLEIGNVAFFNALVGRAGFTADEGKKLRMLISCKDMLGVEMFLKSKKLPASFTDAFLLLPSLFGERDVLKRARGLCSHPAADKALDDLDFLFERLERLGLSRYASVDLGLVRGEYYSGLVMRGVADNVGVSILDGGRYDSLSEAFGTDIDAVGFAIGIKRLLIALEKAGKLVKCPPCDCAYISDGQDVAAEYAYIGALRARHKRVKKLELSKAELLEHCKNKGIGTAVVFKNGKAEEITCSK